VQNVWALRPLEIQKQEKKKEEETGRRFFLASNSAAVLIENDRILSRFDEP